MKNLTTFVSVITVLVLFCISCKNSLSVTLDGARSTAVCTAVDRSVRRSGGRRRITKYSFRYTDLDGQMHSAAIQYRVFWQRPEVGESVSIVYSTRSPDLIYYDSVFHVWMFPVIFGCLLVAAVVKRVIRRRPKVDVDYAA